MAKAAEDEDQRQHLLRMSQDAEDSTPDSYCKPRPPMNQEEFDEQFDYKAPPCANPLLKAIRMVKQNYCKPFSSFNNLSATVLGFVPILSWLPKYSIKECLIADVIGGLTVGIMHVPQGIAYASLAGVTPVVGLYMSFLAPLFYMLFGTSRHTSLGSFAVVSLMCGVAVERILADSSASTAQNNSTATVINEQESEISERLLRLQVASTLTFVIGIINLLMAIFRLHFLATYFSDQVVAGFTTAASCHVFVSQLKEVFYVKGQPRRNGFGQLFLQLYDIARCITQINLFTLLVTVCSIVFLLIGKEVVNPWIKRRRLSPVPIPFELLLLIIATVISSLVDLHNRTGVRIVSHIPTGFPSPHMPQMKLVMDLLVDGIQIALVVFAVHISMAKMFAKKMGYKVDPGQELYAVGATSVLSSFFPVYPISCSLGRTVTNVNAGTKTQLSSIFSSILLVAIIAYFGQFLSALPMCVLSSVVIVALLRMFRKISELRKLWPISKIDFSIWIVSFLGTVIYDVKTGLAISIGYALMTTVFRTQWSYWHLLSNLKNTNDYRDSERYHNVTNYDNILIFRFDSPLLFTNVERFKEVIHKHLDEWRNELRTRCVDYSSVNKLAASKEEINDTTAATRNANKVQPSNLFSTQQPLHFVIDCSGFTFVDYMGVNTLKEIFSEMDSEGFLVYFASAKAPVREMFASSGFYAYVPKENFYPTIRDAVSIAKQRHIASKLSKPGKTLEIELEVTADEQHSGSSPVRTTS